MIFSIITERTHRGPGMFLYPDTAGGSKTLRLPGQGRHVWLNLCSYRGKIRKYLRKRCNEDRGFFYLIGLGIIRNY